MSLEAEKAELERILRSPQFRRAPKLQRFLELVCEYHFQSRPDEINEYLLATQVFGKGPEFDPGDDSLVRVQAREVRRRLREYYQESGRTSRIVLDLPQGSYSPVFTTARIPVDARPGFRGRAAWVTIGTAVLVCAALLLATDRERRLILRTSASAAVRSADAGMTPELGNLWKRFVDSDVPTMLVLSNPDVGECAVERKSTADPDGCVEEYTGMGEAVAIHLITNLFRSARQPVMVKQSRMVTAEDVKRCHLILLGGKMVNPWTRRLGQDLSLDAPPEDLTPTEAREFSTVLNRTGQLTNDRGLIALRRNPDTGLWVLFLYGKHSQGTLAAAEAATDGQFLSQLRRATPASGFPENFHVLIGVAVNDGIPQRPIAVAMRVP